MKLLVTGSRNYKSYKSVIDYITKTQPSLVIQGGAPGADTLAKIAAANLGIQTATYEANWNKLGKSAGFIRNKQMLEFSKPDQAVAFWDGVSPGTKNMIELINASGIALEIIK